MPDQSSTQPEGIPLLYINAVQIGVSWSDFRLFLGEQIGMPGLSRGEEGVQVPAPSFTPRVCITVSAEFARQLAQVLTHAADDYAEAFGKIREKPADEALAEKWHAIQERRSKRRASGD